MYRDFSCDFSFAGIFGEFDISVSEFVTRDVLIP